MFHRAHVRLVLRGPPCRKRRDANKALARAGEGGARGGEEWWSC